MYKNADFGRFLAYHGLVMRDRADGQMEVYGESKCRQLKSDAKGAYSCAVYETRPQICRDWLCEDARKEG
jgi:Fe-S-cluster containining protein